MRCSRLAAATLALTCAAAAAQAQGLDGHPFRTLAPDTLPWGTHVLEAGVEYRTSATPQPLLSDERGDLLRAPEIRYRVGFGRAELSVGGAAWQSFDPEDKALRDEDENGDASLFFTVQARKPKDPGGLAIGFAAGMKLPNASNDTGLGTDEQDAFLAFLMGQRRETLEWRFNAGMAILGDPLDPGAQEDMLTYALAGKHGRRHCVAWEIYGRTVSGDKTRDLEEATLEAGYLFAGQRVTFDVSLLVGLNDVSGDLGASAGMAWTFGAK